MGGTYTWKRPLRKGETGYWEASTRVVSKPAGDTTHNSITSSVTNVTHPGTKEVTSWRSGSGEKGVSLDETEDDFLLGGSTTAADRFKIYRRRHGADHGSSTHDSGHVFSSSTKFVVCRTVSANTQHLAGGTRSVYYNGPVFSTNRFAVGSTPFYGTTPPPVNSWYGTQAINILRPTNPSQDIAVTLAELKREGLPHMHHLARSRGDLQTAMRHYRQQKRSKGKRVADEWLAANFGWLPIKSAVEDFSKVLASAGDILRQYHRDEGRLIRRSITFPTTETTTVYSDNGSPGEVSLSSLTSAANDIFDGVRTGTRREVLVVRESYRFTGAFMYKLPPIGTFAAYLADAQKISGYQITPEVLWNLAPWSWFSDWNWNFGAVLDNANSLSSDGLVLAYGYLTRIREVEHRNDVFGPKIHGYGSRVWPYAATVRTIERVRANPYGFSTNPSSYTAKQWSILAALGLTKAPNTLW